MSESHGDGQMDCILFKNESSKSGNCHIELERGAEELSSRAASAKFLRAPNADDGKFRVFNWRIINQTSDGSIGMERCFLQYGVVCNSFLFLV